MKTCRFFFSLLVLCTSLVVTAQTPTENLQNGVQEYNALRTYFDEIPVKERSMEQVTILKGRVDKAVALLVKAKNGGTAEQIRTATYFIANARYQYGFALGALGKNKEAYDVLSAIEDPIANYTSASFPFRYEFFGKNYIIKWEDFTNTQSEYLTGMTEVCLNLSKQDEALKYAKLSLAHPGATPWYKYITLTKITEIVGKTPQKFTSTEIADYGLQSAQSFDVLSDKEKEVVTEQNYPKLKRNLNQLLGEATKTGAPLAVTQKCIEGAAILAKYEPTDARILELYEAAQKGKATFTQAQAQQAEVQARSFKASHKMLAERVALQAIDVIAKGTSLTNCSGLEAVAKLYQDWQQSTLVAKYQAMAKTCNENRIKEEKRQAKAAKRADKNFNVYAGVYVFPLILKSSYRDYGLVLNLAGKKSATEFSFMKVNRNRTNTFDLNVSGHNEAEQDDLSRWDGYYAHLQPKWYTNGKNAYFGLLLGYANKEFEQMTNIPAVNTNTALYESLSFAPKETQYILMPNVGGLVLGRGLGMDFYMGIGATYNQFEHQGLTATGQAVDRTVYDIDNTVLEYRKDSYFSLIGRVGMTMGLNFGKGNLK